MRAWLAQAEPQGDRNKLYKHAFGVMPSDRFATRIAIHCVRQIREIPYPTGSTEWGRSVGREGGKDVLTFSCLWSFRIQ